MEKLEIISQSHVNLVMKNRRIELVNMGYFSLSRNIFIKNRNVIILKSMVKTTNQTEIEFLSLTKDMYYHLQNKSISIEVFERNCYRSIKIKKYEIIVSGLFPTGTFRNRRYKTYRYLVNQKISPLNIYHPKIVYSNLVA